MYETRSPTELCAENIVTIEERGYLIDGELRFLKLIFQTYQQWKDGDLYDRLGADYTPEGVVRFKAWVKDHNIWFYAAPKECFFESTGAREAVKAGATYLLMENLS